jgi:hypothetical protein
MLLGENKSIDFSKLICMIHAPPANTCLDLNSKKAHVGSYAVRISTSFGHIVANCQSDRSRRRFKLTNHSLHYTAIYTRPYQCLEGTKNISETRVVTASVTSGDQIQ